jgi:hypothetical protein
MRTPFVLLCLCALAGCAGTVSPSQLEPPAKALMVPPKPLADPKKGDDLVELHEGLRKDYKNEASKLRRLQTYVRTIVKQ